MHKGDFLKPGRRESRGWGDPVRVPLIPYFIRRRSHLPKSLVPSCQLTPRIRSSEADGGSWSLPTMAKFVASLLQQPGPAATRLCFASPLPNPALSIAFPPAVTALIFEMLPVPGRF